jgi:hypothetical protein
VTEVPQPVYAPVWLSQADVRSWLRLGDSEPAGEIDRVCADVELYVQIARPDQYDDDLTPPVYAPDALVYDAAVMLAAKVLRRRNSPGGVEAFAGIGVSYVAKYDPEIAQRLHLDLYRRPKTG